MIKVQCPICGQAIEGTTARDLPLLPFCSARCRQIDLGRWLGEAYRLPGQEKSAEHAPVGFDESDSP